MTDPDFKPSSHQPIAKEALDQIFLEARTHNKWQHKPIPQPLLRELANTLKMGPTSANCSPARILFIKSKAAKERLSPFMSEGNRAKTFAAPVTAIIGYDLEFYEHLPKLFPHADAMSWFKGQPHAEPTAFRNSSLQGAYFILAARALGFDCGPMSGFDPDAVNKAFFDGTSYRVNFLCTLGHGDPAALHYGRQPRPPFDWFNKII